MYYSTPLATLIYILIIFTKYTVEDRRIICLCHICRSFIEASFILLTSRSSVLFLYTHHLTCHKTLGTHQVDLNMYLNCIYELTSVELLNSVGTEIIDCFYFWYLHSWSLVRLACIFLSLYLYNLDIVQTRINNANFCNIETSKLSSLL